MTESQINCFITSAMYHSFSRAASFMYISQPAVSKQVSLLEQELGFTLLVRSSTGLSLTPAGKIMYDHLIASRESLASTIDRARRIAEGVDHTIHLGCLEGWDLNRFYPQLTTFFAEKYPEFTLSIEGFNFTDIIAALKSGKVDVILSLYTNLLDNPDIHSRKLLSAGSMLVFSPQHPLAHKPDLSLRDFASEKFFSICDPSSGSTTNAQIRERCAKYGFTPDVVDLPNLASVFVKLQSREGVLLTDEWMMAGTSPLFSTLHMDDKFDIGVGWLYAYPTSALAACLDGILECFSTM